MADESDRSEQGEDMVKTDMTDSHVKITIKNADQIYNKDFDGADLINEINDKFTREKGGTADVNSEKE